MPSAPLAPRPSSPLGPGRWAPDVRVGLERLLAEGTVGRSVAAFDFDDTCLDGDISHAVLEELDRASPGLLDTYQRACARDLRAAWVDLVGTLVAGRRQDEVAALTSTALERGLSEGRLRLVPEMQQLVSALHEAGWEVWVVTASAAPVVRCVSHLYGIAPERVVGMSPAVDPDGRYTAHVLEPVTYREGKLAALRLHAGCDPVLAAGDSPSDLAMMRAARHAILVDRGDAALRDEARERGWWVQEGWR